MALLLPASHDGQDDVVFVNDDVFMVPWLGLRWYSGADMLTVVVGRILMQTRDQQNEDRSATSISHAAEGSATPEGRRAGS